MGLRDTFLNLLGVDAHTNKVAEARKTSNALLRNSRDFLKYGNRETLTPDWSEIKMSDQDMYRGYSYAVIQKRSNKVASLAKTNLKTWANPEVVDEFQKKGETVIHPYLRLIEESTKFTEKQFWKNISIYLDLAGRYYLGVIRNEVKPLKGNLPTITTDIKEFVMLNPYEIHRVLNKDKQVAGYIERKKDGRYREWPLHQIIEMRELNPFDPEYSQWAISDAAKEAVYTLNQSGDYTRQSMSGNIDAPGIITTDLILNDEDFANFRARVQQHKKGEPLFGNGAGSIKWESMQLDLDKAALMDINEINRTALFAVSGTSKTALGIEQSGTTRDTARVQSDQFTSDTVQPRLEDIVDFLNLDYKKHYSREYAQTGYTIQVESGVSRDYATEQQAVAAKQAQVQLVLQLVQSGYTTESAYQFAEGEIELADLELKKGLEEPQVQGQMPQNPEEPEQPTNDNPNEPDTPNSGSGGNTQQNSVEPESGWIGATTDSIKVSDRLTPGLKAQIYTGELNEERTNIPAEEHPHFTVMYGLTQQGMAMDWDDIAKQYLPKSVKIEKIDIFEPDRDYNVLVARLNESEEVMKLHDAVAAQDHYEQEFDYNPHITLCYINKDADKQGFINAFKDLEGQEIEVKGLEISNPWEQNNSLEPIEVIEEHECCDHDHDPKIETYANDISEADNEVLIKSYNELLGEIRSIQKDAIENSMSKLTINSFEEADIITKKQKETFTERLMNALKRYWWVLMPMFGNNLMGKRNSEFNEDKTFVFTNELQSGIETNAKSVASSHMNTILDDILEASNRAFVKVTETAAGELIIKAYRNDPDRFSDYFENEPTIDEAISAIETTDILEKNKRIYQRANKMALDGYKRTDIVRAIENEYDFLSRTRATTIARNETSRAFTQSQFQADYQFLKSINKLDSAYKQLYSRSGHPCRYCQKLIDKGPIPFMENFLDKGQEITITENGKTHTFTANYEDISAGVVHVNCQCEYKLVFKNSRGEFTNEYRSNTSDDNLSSWLNSYSNRGEKLENGSKKSGNFGHAGRPDQVGGSAPQKQAPIIRLSDAQIIDAAADAQLNIDEHEFTMKSVAVCRKETEALLEENGWSRDSAGMMYLNKPLEKTNQVEDGDSVVYKGFPSEKAMRALNDDGNYRSKFSDNGPGYPPDSPGLYFSGSKKVAIEYTASGGGDTDKNRVSQYVISKNAKIIHQDDLNRVRAKMVEIRKNTGRYSDLMIAALAGYDCIFKPDQSEYSIVNPKNVKLYRR